MVSLCAAASTVHTLQGVNYDVDTIQHYSIGPGCDFTELRYQSQENAGKHFTACVMVYDLTQAAANGLDFRMHLGQDSVHTTERMSEVAKRHTDENNQYIAAINGDFYITWTSTPGLIGFPNMTACSDGEMALSDRVDYSHHLDAWIMDKNYGMWCDKTELNNVIKVGDTEYSLYGVNIIPTDWGSGYDDSEVIVFYNRHRGNYTGTYSGRKEIQVELAEGEQWGINKTIKLVVTSAVSEAGHMAIPDNGGVIACGTNAALDLSSLQIGDVIELKLGFTLPTFDNIQPDVKEVVGGDVTLLRNGEAVFEANRFINSRDAEYPRTMVGYDQNRTKMVWVAVDGKTTVNTGCSYPQGADLMKALGCIDAVNMDGGGSTMMWTQQGGIMNTPSDGAERAVGNGLFAVLQKPADNVVASIKFKDSALTSPKYGVYVPTILGYNQYGQLIETDIQGVTYSCSSDLGYIMDDGLTVMINGSGTQPLYAEYNGMTAAMPVHIVESTNVTFNVSNMLVDNYHTWNIESYATVDNKTMPLSPLAFTWESTDTDVATVDDNGGVTGVSNGTAVVTGSTGTTESSVNVTVECPVTAFADIENPVDISRWSMTVYNVKDTVLTASGTTGFNIDYTIKSVRSPRVALTPVEEIRLWSIPEAMLVEFTPTGDATVASVMLNVTPANDKVKKIKLETVEHDTSNTLTFNFADELDVNDPAIYPLTFNSITFNLSGSASATGSLKIDKLQACYPLYSGLPESMTVGDGQSSATPVYYNLQGIRIDNPTAGIYIVVRGTTVTKEIIK